MFEQLFGSKTRVKLLKLFYSNPGRQFYVRELTRKIKEQINSVRRELANLISAGVVTSRGHNNRLYYQIHKEFEFYDDFKNIFTKAGADVSEEDKLTKRVRQVGRIFYAQLSGFFTSDFKSPVDFFIVGDINKSKLAELLAELETENNREINFSTMPLEEFTYRSMLYDRFLTEVLESKKTVLIDDLPQKEPEQPKAKAAPTTEPDQEVIAS